MKEFIIALIICISFLILAFYTVGKASANEPQKDCNYVPKPSDQVYYTCGEQAIGSVEVKLWICGQQYTIDVKCPK